MERQSGGPTNKVIYCKGGQAFTLSTHAFFLCRLDGKFGNFDYWRPFPAEISRRQSVLSWSLGRSPFSLFGREAREPFILPTSEGSIHTPLNYAGSNRVSNNHQNNNHENKNYLVKNQISSRSGDNNPFSFFSLNLIFKIGISLLGGSRGFDYRESSDENRFTFLQEETGKKLHGNNQEKIKTDLNPGDSILSGKESLFFRLGRRKNSFTNASFRLGNLSVGNKKAEQNNFLENDAYLSEKLPEGNDRQPSSVLESIKSRLLTDEVSRPDPPEEQNIDLTMPELLAKEASALPRPGILGSVMKDFKLKLEKENKQAKSSEFFSRIVSQKTVTEEGATVIPMEQYKSCFKNKKLITLTSRRRGFGLLKRRSSLEESAMYSAKVAKKIGGAYSILSQGSVLQKQLARTAYVAMEEIQSQQVTSPEPQLLVEKLSKSFIEELRQPIRELQKVNSDDAKALLRAIQSLSEVMAQAVDRSSVAQKQSNFRPLNFLGPL